MSFYDRFPALVDLGGYFNEDWQQDAPTWEALVDFYVSRSTEERCNSAVASIAALLREVSDDGSLSAALDELGFAFLADPLPERVWLAAVAERIQAGTTPGSESPHVDSADGPRIDPFGNPVTQHSPWNHTSIDWDLG